MIKAVADYVRNIQDTSDLDAIAKDVFQHSQVKEKQKCMDVCLLKYVAVTNGKWIVVLCVPMHMGVSVNFSLNHDLAKQRSMPNDVHDLAFRFCSKHLHNRSHVVFEMLFCSC